MTAYQSAFNLAVNLAERVLFMLFYERQTPLFVLHPIWSNTSLSSCCLSGTNSSKLFAPYFLFDMAFRTSSIIHIALPTVCALVGCDRHLACCEIKKRIISLPAMSVPSWRDRHSACCQIIKQKSSSPVMSNALMARPPFGLLSKKLLARLTSCALVGLDCSWLAVPR